MEPAPEDDSSADEEVPEKGAGWRGTGPPMSVGEGYATREYCDGQALASPGRWPVPRRRFPETRLWKEISSGFMRFAEVRGTPQLLMELAPGKVKNCPFPDDEIKALKRDTTEVMRRGGISVSRTSADRADVPIDYRYLDTQRCRSGAKGVTLGPGVRMPRLPALYAKKRRWRLPDQADPVKWQEERAAKQGDWRQSYSSVAEWSEECVKITNDQAERGQVLRLSAEEARQRFPGLTEASLGAIKKEKPGEVTARILFDGTHGLDVNTRTRISDQGAPIAADVKRVLREKTKQEEPTFALTADISEAHRQVPIDAREWHFLGCQATPDSDVHVRTQSARSASHPPHNFGPRMLLQWDVSRGIWRGTRYTRGTCWSQMTIISTQEAEPTVQL